MEAMNDRELQKTFSALAKRKSRGQGDFEIIAPPEGFKDYNEYLTKKWLPNQRKPLINLLNR